MIASVLLCVTGFDWSVQFVAAGNSLAVQFLRLRVLRGNGSASWPSLYAPLAKTGNMRKIGEKHRLVLFWPSLADDWWLVGLCATRRL